MFPTKSFSGATNPDEPFDPAKMILDHIYDSYEWHIFSYNGHHYSVPLPIILYHQGNGVKFFMSSKLHSKDILEEDFTGYKLDKEE